MDDPGTSGRLISEEDVKKISDGLLFKYEAPLVKVQTNLSELTSKQSALINCMTEQNKKMYLTQNDENLKNMFADIHYCRDQLVQIKKQMASIHERTSRLKTRANHVLSFAKNKQVARKAQLENEQRLIGGHKS